MTNFDKYCITIMHNNLIVSHNNNPQYVDVSRYATYQYIDGLKTMLHDIIIIILLHL